MEKIFRNKPPRVYLENQIYFVTSKTFHNQPIFKDKNFAGVFLDCLEFLEGRGDAVILAAVLLFDHFHLLLKPKKKNISEVIHDLKSYTAQRINNYYRQGILALPIGKKDSEAGSLAYKSMINLPPVWQRSFYCHLILSEKDLKNHFNYIIFNPVKHNYVTNSQDWPYSFYDFKKFDL